MRNTEKLKFGNFSLKIIRTVIVAVIFSVSYLYTVKPISSFICTAGIIQAAIDLILKGWSDSIKFGFYQPFYFHPVRCIGGGWEPINNYITSACATSDRLKTRGHV